MVPRQSAAMVPRRSAVLLGSVLAVSLAAAAASAAVEDDTTCLLQKRQKTMVARRQTQLHIDPTVDDDATSLLQQAGPVLDGPSRMMQTVNAIVDRSQSRGGRVTPEEAAMIRTVAQMIEDVSLPALETGTLENQRQVDRVGVSLATCEAIRGSADAEPGGVEERRTLLTNSRASHRSCRALEGGLEVDMSSTCGNFADYAAGLIPPAPYEIPSEPSAATEGYLLTNNEWFNQKYVQYMAHKERCDSATQLHAAMRQGCNGNQTAFETSSCAMTSSVHGMCAPYTGCRDAADVEQVSTWEDVIAIEEQRKLEFVTLKKIKCLILSLAEAEGEARTAQVAACAVQDLEIRYDATDFDPGQLNISYPVIAARFICSEDESTRPLLPCGQDFLDQEYGAGMVPPNAPPAACVPCTGVPGPPEAPITDAVMASETPIAAAVIE